MSEYGSDRDSLAEEGLSNVRLGGLMLLGSLRLKYMGGVGA
jgi:hypothetical protein